MDARARERPAGRSRRRPGARDPRDGRATSAGDGPPPEELQPPSDPETSARVICLRLLDHRARSRGELEVALRKRGIPDDAAAAVLDRFTEVGLIDDTALAQSLAGAAHRERGLARRAVAVKLRQRGFDDEVVGHALTGIDSADERSRALALVTRRQRSLASLPPDVQTRRLVGLLARKGYPSGLAYEVVRHVLNECDQAAELPEAIDLD